MWFVGLGLVLIVLNLADVGLFGAWEWPGDAWKMLWPFGLALVWWAWADSIGLTQKREMDKLEAKKEERRRGALNNLGMDERGRRHTPK